MTSNSCLTYYIADEGGGSRLLQNVGTLAQTTGCHILVQFSICLEDRCSECMIENWDY